MISGTNMLLEDAIVVLSFRNMFLSISKIGHEGPSTVLEDMENWLEFMIGAHFCESQLLRVAESGYKQTFCPFLAPFM